MTQRRNKKSPREKDPTARFLSGAFDADSEEGSERFGDRSKYAQQRKTEQTALMRAAEALADVNTQVLPIGEVTQVFSLFYTVTHASGDRLCVVRKTLAKVFDSSIVVGDRVRFLDVRPAEGDKPAEGVIEEVLPRTTLLTRADSFNAIHQHPIVANAQQMLIVAAVKSPTVKWGLIDRMLIAAQGGGLFPILCLNKLDLAPPDGGESETALLHYASLGIAIVRASIVTKIGLAELAGLLQNKVTVLAGHSGVGKSSLIAAVQPGLDLRIGAISNYTDKGRHTTTSARRYKLDAGGFVIDTPGVKTFGLWGVSQDNVAGFFPDVEAGIAPAWRTLSFDRIRASLAQTR